MNDSLDELIEHLVPKIDAMAFAHADSLDERLDIVMAPLSSRLYSHQLADVWAALIGQINDQCESARVRSLVAEMLRMSPSHDRAMDVYSAFMRPFDPLPSANTPVFLIASCKPYLDKARRLRASLAAHGAVSWIVTGDEGLLDEQWHEEGCVVPVADTYEALPLKVARGVAAIVHRHGACAVVKIDDDCWPTAAFDPARFSQLASQADYVGVPVQDPCHDRTWHHGKTSRPMGLYTRKYRGPWARGACYMLGAKASDLIARDVTFYPGEFACEFYEDKAVGDCLRGHGVALTPLASDAQWGIAFDITERRASAPVSQVGRSTQPLPPVNEVPASIQPSRARIPKVIHLTWVGDDTKRPDNCIQTWIDQNPGWTIKIWGNDDLQAQEWINARHIKAMWNKELNGVADLMRWEILYNEGGIVVDADSVCVRPLDDWLLEADAVACWENEITRPRLIACNMIGAVPQNPFIGQIIQDLHAQPTVTHDMAWKTVGPLCITQAYFKYRYTGLTILPSHFFVPDHFSGVHYEGQGIVFAKQEWASTHQSYDTLHLKKIA